MLADLAPILERWRPGLLIHDSAEMAGAVAAEVAGIVDVEHSFGLFRPLSIRQAATDVVAPISAAAGVRNPGLAGSAERRTSTFPPRLQFPEILSVPNASGSGRSDRGTARLRVRGVARTPGRSSDRLSHDGHRLQRDGTPADDVDAIDGLDVDVVLTLGPDADRPAWALGRSTSTWRRSSRRRPSSAGAG